MVETAKEKPTHAKSIALTAIHMTMVISRTSALANTAPPTDNVIHAAVQEINALRHLIPALKIGLPLLYSYHFAASYFSVSG